MHSIHNEGKSVVAERFIRALKTKIYKYMTSVSKNVYIDNLDDIVDGYTGADTVFQRGHSNWLGSKFSPCCLDIKIYFCYHLCVLRNQL